MRYPVETNDARVIQWLRKRLQVSDQLTLASESRLADLGVDSMLMLELILDLESSFEISVDDEQYSHLESVGDLARLLPSQAER